MPRQARSAIQLALIEHEREQVEQYIKDLYVTDVRDQWFIAMTYHMLDRDSLHPWQVERFRRCRAFMEQHDSCLKFSLALKAAPEGRYK